MENLLLPDESRNLIAKPAAPAREIEVKIGDFFMEKDIFSSNWETGCYKHFQKREKSYILLFNEGNRACPRFAAKKVYEGEKCVAVRPFPPLPLALGPKRDSSSEH